MGVVLAPVICVCFPSPIQIKGRKMELNKASLWATKSVSVKKSSKMRSKSKSDMDDDMEGYLNSLSLEYDSVWDTKPSWCQPWTIGLTGVSVIACSWLLVHSVVITVLVSFLISAWWYIFLYSYPKAYTEMIAERRERVKSGTEDTYGRSKN